MATRAERIPASEPDSESSGGITMSSAGSRESELEPGLDGQAGEGAHRAGDDEERQRLPHDPPQQRQVRPQRDRRASTTPPTAQRTARIAGSDAGDVAHEEGREEEARQRDDVAGGGDDRDAHVVDVPLAPHAERGDRHRDAEDDRRRDQGADHRDDDEVGDR